MFIIQTVKPNCCTESLCQLMSLLSVNGVCRDITIPMSNALENFARIIKTFMF